MKQPTLFLATILLLIILGCDEQTPQTKKTLQITSTSFRVKVNNVYEGNNLLVKNLAIQTSGEHWIKIEIESLKLKVAPRPNAEFSVAKIVLIADMIKTSETTNKTKWLIHAENSTGYGSTGSTIFNNLEAKNLADILEFTIADGIYPIGQDIVIGKFQEKPIILSVE